MKISIISFLGGCALLPVNKEQRHLQWIQETKTHFQKIYEKAARSDTIKTIIVEAALDADSLKININECIHSLGYGNIIYPREIENFEEFRKRTVEEKKYTGYKPTSGGCAIVIKYTKLDEKRLKVELINESFKNAYGQIDKDIEKIINFLKNY